MLLSVPLAYDDIPMFCAQIMAFANALPTHELKILSAYETPFASVNQSNHRARGVEARCTSYLGTVTECSALPDRRAAEMYTLAEQDSFGRIDPHSENSYSAVARSRLCTMHPIDMTPKVQIW